MLGPGGVPLLSVCMIVKNEAAVLPRALASVAGRGAEVIVVDTGSTDDTVAIAEEAGARVAHFAWVDDFSAARNFAFAQATGTWMLVLDADEEMPSATWDELERVLRTATGDGLRMQVAHLDDRGRARMRTASTRFVRNGRGYAYEGRVHEDVAGSILRTGATVQDIDLVLHHHGYTAAESARKDRHARNLRLVRQAQESAPADARHWHYLGLELAIAGDHAAARPWFERMLAERPDHELAGWSASQLAAIHLADRAIGAAWETALVGTKSHFGRIPCLLLLGDIALRDGDPTTALECARELDTAKPGGAADIPRRREAATMLRAEALAMRGSVREAYATLLRAVKQHPQDAPLADALVRVAERIDPAKGAMTATRETRACAGVIAASIGAFVRKRAFTYAVELGERHCLRTEHYAHALARVGRVDEAAAVLADFGESAAADALVLALSCSDELRAADALDSMPARAADAVEAVLAGRRVPEDVAFFVSEWLAIAVALRDDALATKLIRSLGLGEAPARALHALFAWDAGDRATALELAFGAPAEPDAQEVIGLFGAEKGDHPAAAMFLGKRVRAGDAPARATAGAVKALAALGRTAEAHALLEVGRTSRPHAKSLAELSLSSSATARRASSRS